MEQYNFDFSKIERAINENHQQLTEAAKAKAEYQAELEGALLETRDLLHQMQEDSKKESQINTRRFIIQAIVSVAALVAAVVAAVAAVIALM